MKLNIGRTAINLFLILVAAGLLWYIVQTQNIIGRKNPAQVIPSQKVEIPFTDKAYSLSYKTFDPKEVENISLFTHEEKWVGSGFYDNETFFEYPESLNLTAGEHNLVTAVRNVQLDLSKAIDFDLLLNLRSDPNDLENANLVFIDAGGATAKYVLPRMIQDWEALRIPKEQFTIASGFDWGRIAQVKFEFLPRINGTVKVNLGGLRAEPGSLLYNDWNTLDKNNLLLDKRNGQINLLLRNLGNGIAGIKKITGASNFSWQSSYRSLNSGSAGLFFRGNYQNGQGYYLSVSGINGNQWQVFKNGKDGQKVLAQGEIANFQVKPQETYYLKVETQGNNLTCYFSLDGKTYTRLTKVVDDGFTGGTVGVFAGKGGAALFNDFVFSQ